MESSGLLLGPCQQSRYQRHWRAKTHASGTPNRTWIPFLKLVNLVNLVNLLNGNTLD